MATWHQRKAQRRNPVRLDHDTEWTVVIDPPNGFMAAIRFSSEKAAERYASNVEHTYILKPRNLTA